MEDRETESNGTVLHEIKDEADHEILWGRFDFGNGKQAIGHRR
jgi:hypothetical protein